MDLAASGRQWAPSAAYYAPFRNEKRSNPAIFLSGYYVRVHDEEMSNSALCAGRRSDARFPPLP